MKSREINLWLDERWYQALTQQLEVEKLEDKLNEYLEDLVRLLPTPVYEKIIEEIREEERQMEQTLAASQKYAAFRVTENGREEYFRLDQNYELPQASRALRKYLRQGPGEGVHSFSELFPGREAITHEEFDRMAGLRMENTGRVTGVFEIDFDKREVSTVDADGWKTWSMQDVSAAVYHAYRKKYLCGEQYMARFLGKLDSRELSSAGHLSARDVSFAEEITEIDGLLNFYMETHFNVDAMFGTHVCTGENDDTLNIYANYDSAAGQVCDELEVDLHWADGREEAVKYRLNTVEKATLLRKMDDYCLQQTGKSLTEYSAQLLAENMAPPTAPSM
nr:hypothetical protein [uncultured Oscillibacter sp.]